MLTFPTFEILPRKTHKMRTLFPLLLLLAHSFYCSANNDCFNATNIPLQNGPSCEASVSTVTFSFISTYTSLLNTCQMSPFPKDFWLHINVPSTSNIIIRRHVGTTINAQAEVHFAGTDPNYCFASVPQIVGCYDFDVFPNAIVIEAAAPGDYFIRVWDDNDIDTGIFNVSASILPSSINDWIICDDVSGDGSGFKANQLIIQPRPNFDPGIFNPGFVLIDSCGCTDPPLYLFEASDFETFIEGEITATQDPCIEGTSYNFDITDRAEYDFARCTNIYTTCPDFPYYKALNPQYRVRLAIVDSGINIDHEAFENAFWTNKEANGSDNCLLGDLIGYDFQFDDSIPMDSVGHGSAVAGTIVENFPNDIQLELMTLKFHNGNSGYLFDAICGIHYAIDEGASIIVNSWGFYTAENPSILQDAFAKASLNGVLMIVSAGNDNIDIDNHHLGKYPAIFTYSNIITVSALDELTEGVRSYANTGNTSVDLAAIDHVLAPGPVQNGIAINNIDSIAGTSISAPMVARTAAIIKGYYPILQYQDIRNCILQSVKVSANLIGEVATGGFLFEEEALLCAQAKEAELLCSNDFMRIQGTIINDLHFATTKRIVTNATIEDPSSVIMQAVIDVSTAPGFEVEQGSTFNSLLTSCN